MSFIIIRTIYLFTLIPFLGGRNIFFLLVLIELLSWILAIIIPTSISLKYLLIQGYFIFLGLIGLLWFPLTLTLRLLLKVGLPPFHLWFFSISFYLHKNIFRFFITIHKLIPLFFLSKIATPLLYLIRLILISSGILIFQVRDFFYTFISSSLLHTGWIIIAILLSSKTGVLYWMLYSRLVIIIIAIFTFKVISLLGIEQSRLISFSWLILSGIPPFTIFWLKLNILYQICWFRFSMIILLIINSVLGLSSYFRAFHVRVSPSIKIENIVLPLFISVSILGLL